MEGEYCCDPGEVQFQRDLGSLTRDWLDLGRWMRRDQFWCLKWDPN